MRKFVFSFILLLVPFVVCAGNIKIGVVDFQKVLTLSKKGKDAKAKLDKEYEAKKKEIDAKKAEVDALRSQLEKQGSLLSEKARLEKEKEYRRKLRELQAMIQEAKIELARKEQELTNKILRELIREVQEFGRKNGYTLIIEKRGGIIYSDPSVDLTNQIIRLYDQKAFTKK